MALNFIVYVECVLEHQGKYLVIKRPPGKHGEGTLAFPGGGFELADRDAEDVLVHAAKREVFEEVGLELIDPVQYLTSSTFLNTG